MAATLQHPYHFHELIRKELSENCTFDCHFCNKGVRGTSYCCEERNCHFFLHESCASVELPLRITGHPIHPEHPLVNQQEWYSCNPCTISCYAQVAIATLSPLEEEDMIQHVAHDHPLVAFRVNVPNWISCEGCRERIPGSAYGCHGCRLFLHESCARLPQQMLQHPFHPEHPLTLTMEKRVFTCDACKTELYSELAYCCRERDFKLDVICAALPLSLQDQEKTDHVGIDHFSHQHQLFSGQVEESEHTRLRCEVCELKISGEVYYCLGCILFLHKLCADELLQDMVHYLHPEHPLILIREPLHSTRTFSCNCCRTPYSGMAYDCACCEFNLDPHCALQTSSAVRDGVAAKVEHFGHEHPLVLRYFGETKIPNSCNACLERIIGLAYSCNDCCYVLHKSCAELPLQLEHPLHSLHPLILSPAVPDLTQFICTNCSSESGGLTFCCTRCAFYLCIPCATKRPTLKHQLHEHALSHFERHGRHEDSVRCNSCGKTCSIDLYCCTPCYFNLHRDCLPLPPSIQHECHPYHPLVLFDRFVDGLPEYQYCDYCEELRNPDHGVYRCAREECWYTVHIGCVLPEVMQHVNPELGELRKEITSLEDTIGAMKNDLEAAEEKLETLRKKHDTLSKARGR